MFVCHVTSPIAKKNGSMRFVVVLVLVIRTAFVDCTELMTMTSHFALRFTILLIFKQYNNISKSVSQYQDSCA